MPLPRLAVTLVVGFMALSIAARALLVATMALLPPILALLIAAIALSLCMPFSLVAVTTSLLSMGPALLVAGVRAWCVAFIRLRIATHVWALPGVRVTASRAIILGMRIAIVSAMSLLIRISALMLLLTPRLLVRLCLIVVRSGSAWRIIALL